MSTKNEREVDNFMLRDWEKDPPHNVVESIAKFYVNVVGHPLERLHDYIHSKQKPYYWYHRKFSRVPTIDQCYDHDILCKYEANMQWKRDKEVDITIIRLLRKRLEDCVVYEGYERDKCAVFVPMIDEAETNYFIKYGDLPAQSGAEQCYMKQKHRLAWERRHGPVGTGMKKKYYKKDGTVYWA